MKISFRPHNLEFSSTEELVKLCRAKKIDGLQLVCLGIYNEIINNVELNDQEIKNFLNSKIAKRNNIVNIGNKICSVKGDLWTFHSDNHTASNFDTLRDSIRIIASYLDINYPY